VDDDKDSATSLGIMIKIVGNKTQTANDGLEAQVRLRRMETT